MKTKLTTLVFLLSINFLLQAQLTPWQAVAKMGRGINVGNSLEAPDGETTWGNPLLVEQNFDDYKAAGFSSIRIPITWDKRTATTSPYTITPAFLDRVEQIVDWALARGFIVIINAHHEGWLKENFSDSNLARFDSIWAQISRRFKNKSDHLLFEIINEPYPLALEKVNQLNAQILATIRKTNPYRIVVFSGHMWSNIDELLAASIPNDTMLIGYYHSYDPYPFGLEGTGTFGSVADIQNIEERFVKAKQWSQQHKIPVILSEYGATRKAEYNARMNYYGVLVSLALKHNIPFFAWDDGGDFQIYIRTTRKWNEIKDIIINTYPTSPSDLIIGNYADTLIQLKWKNQNPYNDSIIIERKVNNSDFTFFKKVGPNTTSFIDQEVNTKNNFYYYRLKTRINDSTFAQSYPVRLKNTFPARKAYNNTPAKVPGTVEAEKFDMGIEGVSYHDFDVENKGGVFRMGPGVDIFKSGSILYVANTKNGEWMEYTLNVQKDGLYKLNCYASSPDGEGTFKVIFDQTTNLDFIVQKTDTITSFTTSSKEVTLTSGEHIMRIQISGDNEVGIDRIIFQFLTGVEINNITQMFNIFPNPASDQIYVRTSKTPSSCFIYSIDGKLVATYPIDNTLVNLNISKLSAGIYLVKIKNSEASNTFRLIKR
ncbi:MAG: cellulase family glycosylhydrolase [Bacteroidales bacterium]|nr:cellulase family glycosylhydrolase [Bacteroidales bacterium]